MDKLQSEKPIPIFILGDFNMNLNKHVKMMPHDNYRIASRADGHTIGEKPVTYSTL